MSIVLDKYIEIKNLSDAKQTFKRLDNEFIDIMYPDHYTNCSVIMLLDLNIDPFNKEDISWLTNLLSDILLEMGETNFSISPFISA